MADILQFPKAREPADGDGGGPTEIVVWVVFEWPDEPEEPEAEPPEAEPSHPEHAENGHTAWRFHNAVTEALKMPVNADTGLPARAAAPMAMERTIGLTSFLDEIVGL